MFLIVVGVVNHLYYITAIVNRIKEIKRIAIFVELTSLRDLENENKMVLLLDHIVDVTVKNKVSKNNGKTYGNYYLNRVVGKAGEGFQEVDVDDSDVFGGFGAR